MKHFLFFLSNLFLLSIIVSADFSDKTQLIRKNSVAKTIGREDRKDGVHSGNRVLTRIYNHGAIGDLSSSFSGVYPIGSGHAYIFEFSPIIAASVVDANGFRKHIISDGTIGLSKIPRQTSLLSKII